MKEISFSKSIALAFSAALLATAIVGGIAYRASTRLIDADRAVAHTNEVLATLSDLRAAMRDLESAQRGFLITGSEGFLEGFEPARARAYERLDAARVLTRDNLSQQARLERLQGAIDRNIAFRQATVDKVRKEGRDAAAAMIIGGDGNRLMDELKRSVGEARDEEHRLLKIRSEDAEETTASTKVSIVVGSLLAGIVSALLAFFVVRRLTRRIGSVVQDLRSSSTELQAVSSQQASSTKEQATVIQEVTATMSELTASARQISDSGKRVAEIAAATVQDMLAGSVSAERGREAMNSIRTQVDAIVVQILDLGKKSQQIGAILDIINELAEQTNILAINATIESAGAGEAGKRFSVVADEIRKLADRVGSSTKQIRIFIEEMRSSANNAVMVTEAGSHVVDDSARLIGEVGDALKRTSELIRDTSDAAREIQLGTKQQVTAVEQVSVAMNDVAQSARESELSTRQTAQTSTELARLSLGLARILKPQTDEATV